MEALKRNHFEFFSLPTTFSLDLSALERAFHRIQQSVHPDRFANAGQAEKRYAMQLAAQANEAFNTLSQPLSRAQYLCELNDVDLGAENNTAMPTEFLMEQMQWRESLEEANGANDPKAWQDLCEQVDQHAQDIEGKVSGLLDGQNDYNSAASLVRQWMFVDKFQAELAQTGARRQWGMRPGHGATQ